MKYNQHDVLPTGRTSELQEDSYENMIFLAQSGNEEALNWLLEQHTGFIRSLVMKVMDRHDNNYEDLVQEAYMAFVHAIKKFDIKYQVKLITFAQTVILRELYRIMRRINKEVKVDYSLNRLSYNLEVALLERFPDTTNPEKIYYSFARRNLLHTYLNKLPDDTKEMILMYYGFYYTPYTYQQIGVFYNLTKSSVKKRIDRGLESLRKMMFASSETELWWSLA